MPNEGQGDSHAVQAGQKEEEHMAKGELHLTGSGLCGEGMTDAHEGDCPSGQGVWPHRGVLPVQDDLRDVLHGVQQVVVPPLIPVDGHRAVLVHAARQKHGHSCATRHLHLCAH